MLFIASMGRRGCLVSSILVCWLREKLWPRLGGKGGGYWVGSLVGAETLPLDRPYGAYAVEIDLRAEAGKKD